MHEFLEISFLLNVDSESLLEMQVVEQMKKQWGLKKIAVIYLQKKNKNVDYKFSSIGEELSEGRYARPQSPQEKVTGTKGSCNLKRTMPVLLHKCSGVLSL